MAKKGFWIKDKVYHKLEDEKQKLRMNGGSWTINLTNIEGKEIEKVIYITETHTYEISMQDARTYGFVQVLQNEPKLVVPVACWKKKSFVEVN